MKRILKSVVSVLLLFCLAFSIGGCGEETGNNSTQNGSTPYEEPDNQISFTPGVLGGTLKANEIDLYEDTLEIIQTKEDLINVFSKIEIVWEDQPIWERYNEDFFETKSLIFVVQIESGTNIERVVEYVSLKNNEVTVYITEYTDIMEDCAMLIFWAILEVDNADITSVDNIKIGYLYKMK